MARTNPHSAIDADAQEELIDALRVLTDEVRVLREAVDELRDEVQYHVRNLMDQPVSAPHARWITGVPAESAPSNLAERVNALTPGRLPPASGEVSAHPGKQGSLF